MQRGGNFKTSATIDHKTPKVAGGKNSRKNYVLACRNCNQDKGSRPWVNYIKRRKRKGLPVNPIHEDV